LRSGSNSNKRYLIQYVSNFPCGYAKLGFFLEQKEISFHVAKFLIVDKSCQNYALTLRPQVSADTIVARPAIPEFAGTCVRTPSIFLFHHTFGLRMLKCTLP
jgi:hypothetical protein